VAGDNGAGAITGSCQEMEFPLVFLFFGEKKLKKLKKKMKKMKKMRK